MTVLARALQATVFGAFALPIFPQIELHQPTAGKVVVTEGGVMITTLYAGPEFNKPFLAPLKTPAGVIVTRRFPMEQVAQESHDHPHHRGLWIGYGNINEVNFWENEPGESDRVGRIVPRNLALQQDAVEVQLAWVTPEGSTLLREQRRIQFRPSRGGVRLLDLDCQWTAARDSHFADTKEGLLALRLADSMTEAHGGKIFNSEGAAGERQAWGKRARWAADSGVVDGHQVTVLLMSHPGNIHAPERWHVRGYGLLGVNPFGTHAYDPAVASDGGFTLRAGQRLHLRYRLATADNKILPQEADRLTAEFAAQP